MGPKEGKVQAQAVCPRAFPFPLASVCPPMQWAAGEPLPTPKWEMASSSLWVAACRMALGSWSWSSRMSLGPERGQVSEGCLGL